MAEQKQPSERGDDRAGALATIPRPADMNTPIREGRSVGQSPEMDSPARTTDERRIVTILFCDVAGSTTMAERLDPEEWAEVMHEAFEYLIRPVERFGGTVARLMGDAVLAFFGAPEAHEDDPQRAILAGLEILDAIRPLHDWMTTRYGLDFNVRVGVNTGHVVVGDFGARDRYEYTAMGDAINLAARIQELAQPGTVQVASTTYRLAAPFFEFEPLGAIEIRGKTHQEAIYRVVRPTATAGRVWDVAGLGAPLIGRDAEMAQLQRALDELRSGRGQIILLEGDAGLGKSRLLEELRRRGNESAPDDNRNQETTSVAWLENRVLSYESIQPYGALEQRLRRVFGIDRSDSPDVVRDKIRLRVNALSPEFQAQAIRVVKRILAVDRQAGRESLETTASELDADTFKREMYTVMLEILRNWNHGGPVVFMSDDVHLSDAASSDLYGYVLQLVEQMPILFVSAFRPDEQSPVRRLKQFARTQHADRCIEIHLEPLPEPASMQLLDALVEISEEHTDLRELILRKADGVPLFIEEIVRSLVDQGALEPVDELANSRWRTVSNVDVSSVSIPDSIQALMLQRVDRLNVETRRVLQQAAVIGRTFPLAILQSIAPTSSDTLEEQLSILVRLGHVVESGNESDREYSFSQPLLWEVVYSTVVRRQRREVHRQVAEAMEKHYHDAMDEHAASLGHHYFRAGDSRAISWLLRAAERAWSIYEPRAVIEYVNMAQRLAEELNTNLPTNAFQVRGLAHELVGDYDRARDDFEHAIERALDEGNLRDEWQALISLGMAWSERDYAQAGKYYHRALERARQLSDEPLVAHSLNRLGNWYSNTGTPLAAFQAHHDAIAIFDRLGDRRGLAETRDLLGMACYLAGDLPAAADYFNQALTLFRDIDDRQGVVSSLTMLTLVQGNTLDRTVIPARGQAGDSQYAVEARSIAREINWEAGEAFAEVAMSLVAEIRGEYGHALAHAERAQHLAVQINHRQWTVAAHVGMGTIKFNLFQLDEARQHLELALAEARQMGSDNWINFTGSVLAGVYLTRSDLDGARKLLESLTGDDRSPNTVARRGSWYQRAALELAAGNIDESLSIVDRLTRSAPHNDQSTVLPHLALLRAQALTRLRRYQEAEHELQSARTRAKELGYLPLMWRIELAYAELYREQGETSGRESALQHAKAIVDELAAEIQDQNLQEGFRRATQERLERARRPLDPFPEGVDEGTGVAPDEANPAADRSQSFSPSA